MQTLDPREVIAALEKSTIRTIVGPKVRHDARFMLRVDLPVDRYVFDNGLRVLLLEEHSAPIVAINTWVGSGARRDPEGKTGLAHLVEHLVFHDDEAGPFISQIEELGGFANAMTTHDNTALITYAPASALERIIQLECTRLGGLRFSEPSFLRERDVVDNERRQMTEDDPSSAAIERIYAEIFPRHPYGRRIAGTQRDIASFELADPASFYATHYRPDNAVLVVVGDIDSIKTLGLVREAFAGREALAPLPVEDQQPEYPMVDGLSFFVEADIASPRLLIGYRAPGAGYRNDHLAMWLLNVILFNGRASRVWRELVEGPSAVAVDVGGTVEPTADDGVYMISISGCSGVDPDRLLAALDACIKNVQQYPVSMDELDRACAQQELMVHSAIDATSELALVLGFGEAMLGNPLESIASIAAARHILPGDILRVARRYLRPTNRCVCRLIPKRGAK